MDIFQEDLETLNADNYINDNIIDFMLKYKYANNIVLMILNVHLFHQIEFPLTRKTTEHCMMVIFYRYYSLQAKKNTYVYPSQFQQALLVKSSEYVYYNQILRTIPSIFTRYKTMVTPTIDNILILFNCISINFQSSSLS